MNAAASAARPFLAGWLVLQVLALVLACHPSYRASGGAVSSGVAPDAAFEGLFAERGHGWTGGDGAASLLLPDGRTLWLFGDSFLGVVEADGRRSADTPFIRNCLLLQAGDRLTPRYGQRDGAPAAFFRPENPDEWYWPGDGTVQGQHLFVFLHRFRRTHPGLWGWQWTGTDLARLGLPGLSIEAITPLPSSHDVRWGAALLEHKAQIYIFGVVDKAGQRHLHVARTPAGPFAGPWSYFDGRSWSATPRQSVGILTGVSSQFSVVAFRNRFVLVTMDERQPFSGRLVAYSATRPEGPFQGPTILYEAPEADDRVAAYNPFVHPQFTQQGRFLISYNVNHLHDAQIHYRDARLYRPRFIRLDLAAYLRPRQQTTHEFGGSWGWGTSRSGRR
jgi:hypothetical protein